MDAHIAWLEQQLQTERDLRRQAEALTAQEQSRAGREQYRADNKKYRAE